MSKGSKQRPTDQKKYNDNWDLIFGKKKEDKKDVKSHEQPFITVL